MKVFIYEGKRLGKEKRLIADFVIEDKVNSFFMPNKGELIYLPTTDKNEIIDGEAYYVNSVMRNYVHNEYVVFVELYNWED